MKRFATILCLLPLVASAANWYASPSATTGAGSIGDPWNLFLAITNTGDIDPGDTLYLRNGNYRGPGFVCTLNGVLITSYTNELATITDGRFGELGTALNSSGTPGVTTVSGVTITGFSDYSMLTDFIIDEEFLHITARSGNVFTLVRGWGGSTIAAHSEGADVALSAHIFSVTGNTNTIRNVEITSLLTTNRNKDFTNYILGGLDLNAAGWGNKAQGVIVHDTGHPGIGFWDQSTGSEINGCMVWGTGVYDYYEYAGAPVGSAIYSQNETNTAVIRNCITFRNFTTGGKVFGETGPVKNFYFLSNIVYMNGSSELEIASGSTPTTNTWMDGNVMFGSPLLSYQSRSNVNQYFINNLLVQGAWGVGNHTASFYSNNIAFMPTNAGVGGATISYSNEDYGSNDLSVVWNYNTYYLGAGSSAFNWTFTSDNGGTVNSSGGGNLKFQDDSNKAWKDWITFDANSTYAASWPTDFHSVRVFPLSFDANRWHIVVVGNTGTNTAWLNLAALGFGSGQTYTLRRADRWVTAYTNGTYSGSGALPMPLTLTNITALKGTITHFTDESTNVDEPGLFNAFVLERGESTISSIAVSGSVGITGNVSLQ